MALILIHAEGAVFNTAVDLGRLKGQLIQAVAAIHLGEEKGVIEVLDADTDQLATVATAVVQAFEHERAMTNRLASG